MVAHQKSPSPHSNTTPSSKLTLPHSAYKKHEGKLLGVFTIAIYGATLGVVVETVLNADYSAVRQRKPGATTVSPGPTIQGFDVSTITIITKHLSMPLECSNTDYLRSFLR